LLTLKTSQQAAPLNQPTKLRAQYSQSLTKYQ